MRRRGEERGRERAGNNGQAGTRRDVVAMARGSMNLDVAGSMYESNGDTSGNGELSGEEGTTEGAPVGALQQG